MKLGPSRRYTFRGNVRDSRHGWLRLTPAYSVHLVRELLEARTRPELPVLEPFCGTGTTLLSCAELGIECTATDLNPFLVWLARAKAARYSASDIEVARRGLRAMAQAAGGRGPRSWVPPIHQIEKWWSRATLDALSCARDELARIERPRSRQLATVAFCRALIATGNVSFRHQSMSFRQSRSSGRKRTAREIEVAGDSITEAAAHRLPRSARRVVRADSRDLSKLPSDGFGFVLTSPPYCNRMSYIRELRPYMYWLGYLRERKDAGALDWQAIGGTWGTATSNVARWEPPGKRPFVHRGYTKMLSRIRESSDVLSRYVDRYFWDMAEHASTLVPRLARGGSVAYVVGNSKFYDVVVPVPDILAAIFRAAGLRAARVEVLRKRTSKPELFEYLVRAKRA